MKKKRSELVKAKAKYKCSDCGGTSFRTVSKTEKVVICRACGATAHKS